MRWGATKHAAQKLNQRQDPPTTVRHKGTLEVTFFFFFFNVSLFLRDRERESTSRGGAKREGDTESYAGSRL